MHADWKPYLKEETQKPYFNQLKDFLKNEKSQGKSIYPAEENIYKAFDLSPKDIKVVILGQDPYYGAGQAHGLSFSVMPSVKVPPSLQNVYKEIQREFGYPMNFSNGYLMPWFEQGVMLLNSILTVESGIPTAHKEKGWENFTDCAIKSISDNCENVVFMFWGAYAKTKAPLIDTHKHLVLLSAHPSPRATGFIGNGHFKAANDYLVAHGKTPIDWKI